ncbi:uncharacterized protein LOC120710349 isoform X2 [Panicum virgatum]|uniref:uncharacterized protein LOC120710349 isoform X2 n=1 Tax=Panicum virgatum TaxID=38727 RepID=UPI0019D68454|nr:uncharacterized protein LOC120710349 isoform X2 [Panicum virgatum]
MRKRMASTDLEYEFNWDGNESQYDAQSLHGHMAYGRGGDLNSVQQPFQLRPGILLYCMITIFAASPNGSTQVWLHIFTELEIRTPASSKSEIQISVRLTSSYLEPMMKHYFPSKARVFIHLILASAN